MYEWLAFAASSSPHPAMHTVLSVVSKVEAMHANHACTKHNTKHVAARNAAAADSNCADRRDWRSSAGRPRHGRCCCCLALPRAGSSLLLQCCGCGGEGLARDLGRAADVQSAHKPHQQQQHEGPADHTGYEDEQHCIARCLQVWIKRGRMGAGRGGGQQGSSDGRENTGSPQVCVERGAGLSCQQQHHGQGRCGMLCGANCRGL